MKIIRVSVLIFAFLISLTTLHAQIASSMYFMDDLPQSNVLNPANSPNCKFYLGIPVINRTGIGFSSDISLDDVYHDGVWSWNSSNDFDDFVHSLDETSLLSTEVNTSIFSLGFGLKDFGFFHFGLNNRAEATIGIPQDFFKLNDMTIDHDLSTFQTKMQWFSEYFIGYSHQVNDRLTVGLSVKYIAGVSSVNMNFDGLHLNASGENWEYNLDGVVDVSVPADIALNSNGLPQDAELIIDTNDPNDLIQHALLNYNNPGIGIDIGAKYRLIDKLNLSISLTDLGSITWKDNVSNYTAHAYYEFNGSNDALKTHTDGDMFTFDDDSFDDIIDSLKDVTTAVKTNDQFKTRLSPKLYIAAEYEIFSFLKAGLLSKTRFVSDHTQQNFIFNLQANWVHRVSLGMNYNVGINKANSFGGIVGLRLSPFYIYAATDVLMGLSKTGDLPVSIPANFSATNFQFGINLVVGKRHVKTMKIKEEKVFYDSSVRSLPL